MVTATATAGKENGEFYVT